LWSAFTNANNKQRTMASEPHRPPHHHVHAADRDDGADLEFTGGILDGGDEALRTSALPAFVNMVHETGLLPLSTSKAHRPIAFLAIGLFGKRSWRSGFCFHLSLAPLSGQATWDGLTWLSLMRSRLFRWRGPPWKWDSPLSKTRPSWSCCRPGSRSI